MTELEKQTVNDKTEKPVSLGIVVYMRLLQGTVTSLKLPKRNESTTERLPQKSDTITKAYAPSSAFKWTAGTSCNVSEASGPSKKSIIGCLSTVK